MDQPSPKPELNTVAPKSRLWADCVPLAWKPYVQLTRIDLFAGSLLLYWPCTWGLSLVASVTKMPISEYLLQSFMFLLWSTVMHSVGCIWNDICDKDFDRLVERTKNRPLASGTISVNSALLWMCPQIFVLFGLLSRFRNEGIFLGVIEIFVLTPIYPFMKRITYWPQLWLGIAFTWGALISWAGNNPSDRKTMGLLLYTGCSWTIFYDTIYAMMDKKDDARAGIKSTAVLFGNRARLILTAFALNFILGLTAIGLATHQRLPFFVFSVMGTAIHLAWQITTVVFEDAHSCLYRFKSNGTQLGGIVWSGLAMNYVMSLGYD